MTLSDLSDEDVLTMLLLKEIRRLDDNWALERRQKGEILHRYEKTVAEKQTLETKLALAEAEVARLRVTAKTWRNGGPIEGYTGTVNLNPVRIGNPPGEP